jgi:hypothetical protein
VIITTNLAPQGLPQAFTDGQAAWFCARMIEGMARGCVPALRSWNLPPLHRSGVRYQPEATYGQGLEEFALPFQTNARKFGDCDDLAIWRIAELMASGEDAGCRCEWNGPRMHVLVRRSSRPFVLLPAPQGPEEDPSISFGALRR